MVRVRVDEQLMRQQRDALRREARCLGRESARVRHPVIDEARLHRALEVAKPRGLYRSAGARACEESELLAGQVAHPLEKHMRGGGSQAGLRLAVLMSYDGRAAFASSSSSAASAVSAAAASAASTASAAATAATATAAATGDASGASVPADRRPGRQHACRYALCDARQGL